MAKYTVTHSCGHTDTIQLYGKNSEREWRMQREEQKLCVDCFKLQLAKQRKEAGVLAKEECAKLGCAPLEGTEAQVLWAETIRLSFLVDFPVFLESARNSKNSEIIIESLEKTFDWARDVKLAKFWIESRDPERDANPLDFVNAIFGGRKPPATAVERIRHLLLISPHTTLPVADLSGIKDRWLEKEDAAAKAKVEEEKQQSYESAKKAARAAGIVGECNRWWNKDLSKVRFYLNGLDKVIEMEPGQMELSRKRKATKSDNLTAAVEELWQAMRIVEKMRDIL